METQIKRHKETRDKLEKEINKKRDNIFKLEVKKAKSVYKRETMKDDYDSNIREIERLMKEKEESKR